MVLIAENISEDFGKAFWEFIRAANYNGIETGEAQKQFYRFRNPDDPSNPKMIELFSRVPDLPLLPHAHLTPVHKPINHHPGCWRFLFDRIGLFFPT